MHKKGTKLHKEITQKCSPLDNKLFKMAQKYRKSHLKRRRKKHIQKFTQVAEKSKKYKKNIERQACKYCPRFFYKVLKISKIMIKGFRVVLFWHCCSPLTFRFPKGYHYCDHPFFGRTLCRLQLVAHQKLRSPRPRFFYSQDELNGLVE